MSRARIEITAEDRGATKTVTGLRGLFNDLKAGAKDSILTGVGLGAGIGAFGLMQNAVSGVFDAFKLGASELMEAEAQMAQTEARLRSTGGAAKVTREQVRELAEGVQDLTGIDAEAVQEGQNLLLTFTKVRNEVGAGNDIFSRATGIMADMSVALGSDMPGAAMQLGKALNDPIAGITALQRAGVQLTREQKEQIRVFVEAGDVLSAQKVILAELEAQVGGAAEAFGSTTQGKLAKFGRFWEDFMSGLVGGVVDWAEQTQAVAKSQGDIIAGFIGDMQLNFGALGDTIHRMADEAGVGFQTMKDRIKAEMTETGLGFWEVTHQMDLDAKVAAEGVAGWMDYGVRHAAEAIRLGGPVVAEEAGKVAGLLPAEIRARNEEIRAAAYGNMVAYARGELDGQDAPRVAMDALIQAQQDTLTSSAEVTRLLGQLNSAELASGLADGREGVRAQAEATRAAILDRLRQLGIDAYDHGANIGWSLKVGLDSQYGVVRDAAGNLAAAVRGQIGIRSEPKDPDSPLRGITQWGGNIVKTLAGGIRSQVGDARGAAGALGKALIPSMPDLSGLGGGAGPGGAPATGGGGASGQPTVIQLVVDGRTLAEIVDPWLYRLQPAGAHVLPRGT